jgi:hypothetical protein
VYNYGSKWGIAINGNVDYNTDIETANTFTGNVSGGITGN